MLETTQTITIDRSIDTVWSFARDIDRWAQLMPGLQECDIIDADNSRWVLKVGAGGMVRTVTVHVNVEEWNGPQRAVFNYRLEKDPVQGGGTFTAQSLDVNRTEVALHVVVQGSAPMAAMWEAMGKPVLPKLAAGFAAKFKSRIESETGDASLERPSADVGAVPSVPAKPPLFARFLVWLRTLVTGSPS